MVRRITRTKWYDYLNFFNAYDEWCFEIEGLSFRVVNRWVGSIKLLRGNVVLAKNNGTFATSGTRPLLQARFQTNSETEHSIAIYVKAILTVTIKVEVDGKEISNGFL